jgi:hypothetical protein
LNAAYRGRKKNDSEQPGRLDLITRECNGVERYEQMRQKVLSGDQRNSGLAIFIRHGMKAWMIAASESGVTATPKRLADSESLGTPCGEIRAQAVIILAGMAFSACHQEAQ